MILSGCTPAPNAELKPANTISSGKTIVDSKISNL